jgi:6,7-dimethyl-8-ribityllumazine synthase
MSSLTFSAVKGLSQSEQQFDGSVLRIAIVHARWNKTVIDALVAGAVTKLKERGVKESNIVIQSVPGSFELPLACQRRVQTHIPNNTSLSYTQGHRRCPCAGRRQCC